MSSLKRGVSRRLLQHLVFRGGLTMLSGVAITLSGLQAALAQPPANLDEFVRSAMKQYNVPGVAIAVVDGDSVSVRGYGVRNVESGGGVDGDTIFMIASNTKSFTAALLATFVDQHKLNWDDRVMNYMPEFVLKDSYATRNCTARDLLAHRTGLPAFTGDNLEAFGFDRTEIMRRIRFIEPACTFREKAGYSNPGFFAAGMLAGKLGGDTYEHLIQKRLFAPLEMTRSGVTTRSRLDKNCADGHMPSSDGGSRVIAWDDADPLGPAGEITSTARDMANWVRMLLNDGSFNGKQVVTAESVHEMHKPAMVEEPSFAELAPINDHCGFSYGLGWGIYQYQGHQIVEKGGARAGMRSLVTLIPDKKVGVVVLANQNLTVVPEAVRAYLMDKMVAPAGYDVQADIEKSHLKIKEVFGQKPAEIAAGVKPSLTLARYAGDYENELYGTIKVIESGGKLIWQGGPFKVTGALTPVGYDTFSLSWPAGRITLPEDVTFMLGSDGIPVSLTTESFGLLRRVGRK